MRADGFYRKLPIGQYLADDALSKSGLTDLAISPAHYQHRRFEPVAFPAADLGLAVHMLVLEPERAQQMVATPPPEVLGKGGTANTGAYREWAEAMEEGTVILKKSEWEAAHQMARAVFDHPAARALLQGGNPEVSMFWTDQRNARRKCRPDYLGECYVDLKTTVSAHPEAFGRQAHNLKYHWSAAWTIDIGRGLGAGQLDYYFIAVEKAAPWCVAVYEVPAELVELARDEIAPVYARYMACREYDAWPGYGDEVQTLHFPRWAYPKQVIAEEV